MIDSSNKKRYVEYSSYSEENLKVIAYGKDLDTVTIYAERSDKAIIGSIWKCDNHTYEVGKIYELFWKIMV